MRLGVAHGALLKADGGEGTRELLHLGAQRPDGGVVVGLHSRLEVLHLVLAQLLLDVDGDLHGLVHKFRHLVKVGLGEAAAGEGGRAHAEAAGHQRAHVAGHRVLVGGDVRQLQHLLHARAVHALGAQVDEAQVVVGAAGHQRVAALLHAHRQRLRVLHHLHLVLLKLGGRGLLERAREAGDGVVVGAALQAREDGEVDLVLDVVHDGVALLVGALLALAVEDHRAAGAAQRLVRGGGHHVGVVEGRGNQARSHQARDVGHVRQQPGVELVRDGAHAGVVVVARVGRGAGHQHLGAEQLGCLLDLVVVNQPGGLVQPVWHGLEVDGHGGDLLGVRLVAVAEVAAVRQVQRHDAVVRLQQRGVHLEVGGGSRHRLHVDAPLLGVQVERLQRALLAQDLGLVDELVAAVVTRARVALAVLVGHHRADRLHHAGGGEVL
mmetsp:Transcript_21342/g.53786  ORF Transcript_21342/g.53786 Transcript_21342/m.53786 type:complete len:436 (+) Transcript_21342:112-1419(+)